MLSYLGVRQVSDHPAATPPYLHKISIVDLVLFIKQSWLFCDVFNRRNQLLT